MQVFAFFIVCLVASLAKAQSPEQQQMFEQLIVSCSAAEGATSDDIVEIQNRDTPTTRTGQCLNACIMETVGLIKNGKLSVEQSMAVAEAANTENIAAAREVAEECSMITDEDRCTVALKIIECTKAAAVSRGIDPKRMLD